MTEYLSEKSRVVFQTEGEQNFHIFYLLFAGMTEEDTELCVSVFGFLPSTPLHSVDIFY